MQKSMSRLLFLTFTAVLFTVFSSCGNKKNTISEALSPMQSVLKEETETDEFTPVNTLLVSPQYPQTGEKFRIVATGGEKLKKAKIIVTGSSGSSEPLNSNYGEEIPYWRIDEFEALPQGKYTVTLKADGEEICQTSFEVGKKDFTNQQGTIWKTTRGWDREMEIVYSAWINALFRGTDEQSSWPSLHEVTQYRDRNFLFNYLSLGEDDPAGKNKVIMEPDCADNPFFLRAYFAWKLGLPFGFHICDRGYLGKNPGTGEWVTNHSSTSKSNPVLAFNSFLRRLMDGVHSGTARTSLDNEKSDYYPVSLERNSLLPGTVFADPYGHTLIIVSWKAQSKSIPGLLLAVDAQPDKTIAVKRFWKGNFLFNTKEVVGEPGFKAFRPVDFNDGKLILKTNNELNASTSFAPFSLQQQKMDSEAFYHAMERLINPNPLDPEEALNDLVKALHEQLLVRVKSVENGAAYMKAHPGTVIPMPSNANAIFQTGGVWEDFSTPNRDLRLLIAMDAVLDFPNRVANYPDDYKISGMRSKEEIREKLQKQLEGKVATLKVSYPRSDGSQQELTVSEILKRKDAFEVAYNPNDCPEIRWGAPEGSRERSTCKRQAPANQQATMQKVRKWFTERLHPPT